MTDLTAHMQAIDQAVRDRHSQVRALDVQISALQSAKQDLLAETQRLQDWLTVEGPKVRDMQNRVRRWLADNP
jgi:hypothetical protein